MVNIYIFYINFVFFCHFLIETLNYLIESRRYYIKVIDLDCRLDFNPQKVHVFHFVLR